MLQMIATTSIVWKANSGEKRPTNEQLELFVLVSSCIQLQRVVSHPLDKLCFSFQMNIFHCVVNLIQTTILRCVISIIHGNEASLQIE